MRVVITKSILAGKKMTAVFYDGDKKVKTIHFGQAGASDFTIHKDEARKQLYIDRHRKRENWNDPMTAGALSLYVLWNKPTLSASIADFKRRFGFK